MGKEELAPYDGIARKLEITLYQRKIGSTLDIAVMTRPDVAFATSRLARFLTNPGPKADRVLLYLKGTSHLGLQIGGEDGFRPSSDASFAARRLSCLSWLGSSEMLIGVVTVGRCGVYANVATQGTAELGSN